MRGLSVTLYIRRNGNGRQRYERVTLRNPQVAQGSEVYCLHFYENGKRKWLTVGSDLRAAYAARGAKEQEIASDAVRVSKSSASIPAPRRTPSLGIRLGSTIPTQALTCFRCSRRLRSQAARAAS